MIGLEIAFRNGKKDWYDPIDEDQYEEAMSVDSSVTELLIVVNGNEYLVPFADIEQINKYALCDICHADVRSCRCAEGDSFTITD